MPHSARASNLLPLLLFGAAAFPATATATSFFRRPDSPFSSGQTNRVALEKNLVRTEQDLNLAVRWDGKDFTIPAREILRDIDCARRVILKGGSQLFNEARTDSPVAGQLANNEELDLTRVQLPWARVRSKKGLEGWLPVARLEAKNEDRGVFVTLMDTFLRDQPSTSAHLRTTIPRATRVEALDIQKGWLKVRSGDQTGFVDLHHVVGRADFAAWAYWNGHGWFPVSHREGGTVKSKDGISVPLVELIGYSADANHGVAAGGEDARLPLRAHVDIRRSEATLWGVSRLDGHGEVWWKKDLSVATTTLSSSDTLTTDELLKRPVFSYALTGSSRVSGLVSARGIWRTSDGKTWTRIRSFGEQDLPVAVRDDRWYVGSFQSSDQGRHFEAFLRWENLAKNIESQLQRPPRYVRLQKIEPLADGQVDLSVDTGVRRVKVRFHL